MITVHRPPFIKICCTASQQKADLTVAAGADALGLVSHMPSGPGVIGDALIAQIARMVRTRPIQTFLLTARQTAASIAEQHSQSQTTHIQLVDTVAPPELLALRHGLPAIKLARARKTGWPCCNQEAS